MEKMDNIEQARGIISDLLVDGVHQWLTCATHDDDDWQYIDRVRAENDFADAVLFHATDEKTRNIIVSVLMESALDTFESIIMGWDDELLKDIPAILDGVARGKEWMTQHGTVKRPNRWLGIEDTGDK